MERHLFLLVLLVVGRLICQIIPFAPRELCSSYATVWYLCITGIHWCSEIASLGVVDSVQAARGTLLSDKLSSWLTINAQIGSFLKNIRLQIPYWHLGLEYRDIHCPIMLLGEDAFHMSVLVAIG